MRAYHCPIWGVNFSVNMAFLLSVLMLLLPIVGANRVEYYSELHSGITPSIRLLEDRSWAWLQDLVHRHRVVVLSKTNCVFSKRVKAVFHMLKEDAHIVDLDKRADGDVIIRAVERYVGYWITPQVFVNGMHYGGAECKSNL